jgi:hypothetical protein
MTAVCHSATKFSEIGLSHKLEITLKPHGAFVAVLK